MTQDEALEIIRSAERDSGLPEVKPWTTREGRKGYSVCYPDQHWGHFLRENELVEIARKTIEMRGDS